ncbi:MAG: ChbG/HpnK family deacetylase [Pseudomonadota bacterium]|nr:ChbG/HpnK family deacetylase [Pseudomonadota bacterium]
MRRIIVNADDFGADRHRDAGIAAAVAAGAVTSVSVLANGPSLDDGLPLLRYWQRRGISVGLHFNLSEGRPLKGGTALLTGVDGGFRGKTETHDLLRETGVMAMTAEIEDELAAQLAHLKERGLRIDHLDGHQHIHIFPAAVAVVARAAARHAIPRIRVPAEELIGEGDGGSYGPADDGASGLRNGDNGPKRQAAAGPHVSERRGDNGRRERKPMEVGAFGPPSGRITGGIESPAPVLLREAAMFSRLAEAARPLLTAAGTGATDHFRGLALKGRLSLPLLAETLRNLPPGVTEFMVHPGYAPAPPVPGPFAAFATADRERELAVLLAFEFRALLRQYRIELISRLEANP